MKILICLFLAFCVLFANGCAAKNSEPTNTSVPPYSTAATSSEITETQKPTECTQPTTEITHIAPLDRANEKVVNFLFDYFRTSEPMDRDTVHVYSRFAKLKDNGFTDEAYAEYIKSYKTSNTEELEAQLLSTPVVVKLWQEAQTKGCSIVIGSVAKMLEMEEVEDGIWAGDISATYSVWNEDLYICFPYTHRVTANQEGKLLNVEMDGMLPILEEIINRLPDDPAPDDYDSYFSAVRPLPYTYNEHGEITLLDPRNRQLINGGFSWNGIDADFAISVRDSLYFVSKDGHYLLRTNKDQTECTILYEDSRNRMNGFQIVLWENCLFFTASESDESDALYRLFLPDGTLDKMVGGMSNGGNFHGKPLYSFTVISNVEVEVDNLYPVWSEFAKKMWNEPIFRTESGYESPAEYYASWGGGTHNSFESLCTSKSAMLDYEQRLYAWHRKELGEDNMTSVYCNSLTGECLSVNGYVSVNWEHCYIHPDENQHFYSKMWWEELRTEK